MSLQDDIKEACDNSDGEVSFYNGYSGRGMYGRTCIGITGSWADCQQILASVIKDLGWRVSRVSKESVDPDYSATPDDLVETMEKYEANIDTLIKFSQDNMGLDIIIYWPDLDPIVEQEEENDGQPDEAQEWHDFDPDC